jgi:hypothetical protein
VPAEHDEHMQAHLRLIMLIMLSVLTMTP